MMDGIYTSKPPSSPQDEAAAQAARPSAIRGLAVAKTVTAIRLDSIEHGVIVAKRCVNVGYPAITIAATCQEGGDWVHQYTWSATQVRHFAEALLDMARDIEANG